MKENQLILENYQLYKNAKIKSALATVVKVDGSAYRRPGARMLVSENGDLIGAISGGCLEGDALRKAQTVIFQNQSMLVTYDTTDEDDQKFGIGLGCNGIIQILMEPIDYEDEFNPVQLLQHALEERVSSTLITIFSIRNARSAQVGTLLIEKKGELIGKKGELDNALWNYISEELKNTSIQKESKIKNYQDLDDLHIFFEVLKPPVQVFLFGAGNDTIPVCKMANLLGWQVVLIDGRNQYATKDRFPLASKIIVSPAENVVAELVIDENSVVLLMTHNFDYEFQVLEQLSGLAIPYIGILGPKKKGDMLIEQLIKKGIHFNTENIFNPLGLNIGAEGSEEIALSILAEIKAVLANKKPFSLREKIGSIHD